MKEVRARVVISGWVQGVCFRASTQQQAQKRHVKGWVRNLNSGQVEAVFQGGMLGVEGMIERCRHGPSGARVSQIEIFWDQPLPSETRFNIL